MTPCERPACEQPVRIGWYWAVIALVVLLSIAACVRLAATGPWGDPGTLPVVEDATR